VSAVYTMHGCSGCSSVMLCSCASAAALSLDAHHVPKCVALVCRDTCCNRLLYGRGNHPLLSCEVRTLNLRKHLHSTLTCSKPHCVVFGWDCTCVGLLACLPAASSGRASPAGPELP
jgi:hypothetical protein